MNQFRSFGIAGRDLGRRRVTRITRATAVGGGLAVTAIGMALAGTSSSSAASPLRPGSDTTGTPPAGTAQAAGTSPLGPDGGQPIGQVQSLVQGSHHSGHRSRHHAHRGGSSGLQPPATTPGSSGVGSSHSSSGAS